VFDPQLEIEKYDYDEVMADAPMDPKIEWRQFKYPGPVAFAFAQSDSPIRIIMGPFGSGKTSAAINEHLTRAIRMPLSKETDEGGRHYRIYKGAVFRSSYRDLYKTSIPSWWEWFPPGWGKWSGGQDRPAQHIVEFEDDYGPIRMIMDFAAIGEANIELFFKGYAYVGAQFEEVDGFTSEVIDYGLGRAGRFPRKSDLLDPDVPAWAGIWGSMNACDFDNWIYTDIVEGGRREPDAAELKYLDLLKREYQIDCGRVKRLFRQPGGLEPNAENIENLRPGYYEQLAAGGKADWVRKNVHNKFGYSRSGEPVYMEEFDDTVHFSPRKLLPVPNMPVDISIDAGGHPSASFRQRMPSGQRRYLREIVNQGGGVGPSRFSDQIMRVLEEEFPNCPISSECYADPSAFYGGDKLSDEVSDQSFMVTVINRTGIRFKPAPSNEIDMRTDVVRDLLDLRIDQTVPAILFCPSMRFTRQGFNSKYAYKKNPKTGDITSGKKPNKLPGYSDIQDCIQYQELGETGLSTVQARGSRRDINRRQKDGLRGRRKKPGRGRGLRKGGFDVFG